MLGARLNTNITLGPNPNVWMLYTMRSTTAVPTTTALRLLPRRPVPLPRSMYAARSPVRRFFPRLRVSS